ncbi:hypothetical protein MPSEU_000733800 [Mayamaea pseudoterrestris]|nr:hypothetical protein MPSEU_000733800 [Mayamaea pseudoterrestris]
MSNSQQFDDDQFENRDGGDDDAVTVASSANQSTSHTQAAIERLTQQEERALLQLQDALDCMVGNAGGSSGGYVADIDYSAYITACERCPEILQNPSFRIPFLRRFNMDPWAAAKRMICYWTERHFLFGDAAFRPLTIAVLPALFQEASIVLLPHRDKEGRSVLFLDRLKLNYEQLCDDKGRAQCLFYLLDLAVQQNPTACTKGIVALALVAKPPKYDTVAKTKDVSWWDSFFQSFSNLYEWKFPRHCVRIATQAMPVQISMIHICTLPQSTGVGYLRTAAVNVCLNMIGSYYSTLTKVHHGNRKPESFEEDDDSDGAEGADQFARMHQASLLRQLRPYGLFKRQLPEVIGGSFTMQNFGQWMQRQSSQEARNFASKEELLQRKREINLVHSRQKRQRRRQEHDELGNQCEQLKIENQHSKAEIYRLETLLRQANDIVRQLEREGNDGSVEVTSSSEAIFSSVSHSDSSAVPVTSMDSPAVDDNELSARIGFAEGQSMMLDSQSIPLSATSNATINYALQPQSTASPPVATQQPAARMYNAANMFSSQSTHQFLQSETASSSTPPPSLSLSAPMPHVPEPLTALFAHDQNIPSAADLCQGFSDDEDDHAFKNQIQDVVEPQPNTLWSSMLGLFRQNTFAGGNMNQPPTMASAAASSSYQEASRPVSSAVFGDHYAHHDFHRPSTFATTSPASYSSPGWQVTTTTTIAPLSPQLQQPYLGQDCRPQHGSDRSPTQWFETVNKSPLTDYYTDRSSPASSSAAPTMAASQSPVDADWYSW